MKGKKNLERAIILGLILSTGVYGSAWATDLGAINDESILQPSYKDDVNIEAGNESGIQINNDGTAIIITTEEPLTSGNGTITVSSNHDAIHINSNGSIELNAVGDNIIRADLIGNPSNTNKANGIFADKNAEGYIKLDGKNNSIIVTGGSTYGIFTHEENNNTDITLNATNGSNSIKAGFHAIYHRGKGTITITANNGGNILHGSQGAGIFVGNAGIINIEGNYNEITSDGIGLAVNGGIIVENKGIVNVTATAGDNTINSISTTGGGKVNVIAAKNNIFSSNSNSVISAAGTNGAGTIYIEAQGDNIIKGLGESSQALHTEKDGKITLQANNGKNEITGNGAAVLINSKENIIKALKNNEISGGNLKLGVGSAINSTNGGLDVNSTTGNNIINGGMHGIVGNMNDTINITANGLNTISTFNNTMGYGVGALSNSQITLKSITQSNEINGAFYGVYAGTSTVELKAKQNNNVNGGTYGIFSHTSSDVKLNADDTNSVGGKTYGIVTMSASTNLEAGKSNIVNSENMAIYAYTNANVDLDADVFNKLYAGELAYYDAENGGGIYGNKSAVYAISGSTVTLDAGNANAISGAVYASGAGTTVDLTSTGQNTYSTNNDIRSAAAIANAGGLSDTVISALYAEKGANISVSGERNVIRTYADYDKPEELERVVWAYDTADIKIDGASIIGTDTYEKSRNSNDIAIAAGTATNLTAGEVNASVEDRATVTLTYDNFTTNDGKQAVSEITGDILSAYAGKVDIAGKSADAGIKITGNLLAGNNGILNVNLGKGGVLTGRADDYGDAGANESGVGSGNDGHQSSEFFDPAFSSEIFKGGEVNLTMGENSRWNVTGQSWITRIKTAENSNAIIDLVGSNTDRNTTAHALTVYEMNGDANFNMNLDADRDVSDMLYIKNAKGNYVVNVIDAVTEKDMYAARTDGGTFDGLRFATVGKDSTASFRAITYDDGFNNVEYIIGSDSYDESTENHHYNGDSLDAEKPGDSTVDDFFENDGTPGSTTGATNGLAKASLMALPVNETNNAENDDLTNVEVNTDETTNFKLIGVKNTEISDGGETILNMSRANYSNAIYMDRLNKRLGEARYINSEEDEGMWVRIRHDRIGKDDAYRSQNTMYELGYDQKQECDNGERRVGMAIDYMHGDTGYNDIAGKGEIDRYGLWLYDTWMGDKGHYADYVAKWGHLSNDFEIYNSRGEVTGDYSNNVFSVSAEYGRKKDIGNDWYFEPQVQAQLARVTGADYTTNQGTKVSVDGINSLIGRAGFRLGKDFGEEKQSTVYIKADVLHEFLGDQDIRALDSTTNGNWQTVSYENEGTWYDVGFGFATQMSKNSYAFMDFEKSFGNDNDETYQINVGMQWSF